MSDNDRPRYLQRVQRGKKVYWRYNPPQKYVDLGVVERRYLSKRKEVAYAVAETANRKLDAYRENERQERGRSIDIHPYFNELAQFYLDSREYKKLSLGSQEMYTAAIRLASNTLLRSKPFGEWRYKIITSPMANELYNEWLNRGVVTANRTLAVVRRIFNVAVQYGLLDRTPFSNIETISEKSRKVVWTHEHLHTFLNHCYSSFETRNLGILAHMAYEFAQRLGDMRLLTWDKLDLDNGVLHLTQRKRGAEVHIPIGPEMLDILRQQKEDYGFQEYVAPNINRPKEGGFHPYEMETLSHAGRRHLDKAGLPRELRLSDLRRTATTEMVEAGTGMAQIMAVTGHKSTKSVEPYMRNTLRSATIASELRSGSTKMGYTT